MNIPKITTHFGVDFCTKLPAAINKYAHLWGLSDFEQVDYYSINCIFTCNSTIHGPCVLKIGSDAKAAENEWRILHEYRGRNYCKALEADIENGVLLIERINPGTRLRDEPDLDKRLDILFELSHNLHIKPADKSVYPTYMGWVSRITQYMRGRENHALLCAKMLRAEKICRELCEKYPGEMLLHGDLHHDNILLDAKSGYRIVDPKGVIGDIVFDIPRFIYNEFGDAFDDNFHLKFAHITRTLAEKFNIPEYDIRRLVYVDTCMSDCWWVEDGGTFDIREVLFAEEMMDLMCSVS